MGLVTITISAADNGGVAAVVPVLVTINSAAPSLLDGAGAVILGLTE